METATYKEMSETNQKRSSTEIEAYVKHSVELLGLSIPPEQWVDVVENFDRLRLIAQPVLEFSLPDNLESATRFNP